MAEPDENPTPDLCGDTTPRDRRNLRRFLWVMGIWVVLFAGGSQALKRGLLPAGPVSWAVATLAALAGFLVFRAYARFLREADELQRLIQLQALAVGFGGTYFGIAGYRLFERAGAPPMDIADVSVLMVFLFSVGLILGQRRYR